MKWGSFWFWIGVWLSLGARPLFAHSVYEQKCLAESYLELDQGVCYCKAGHRIIDLDDPADMQACSKFEKVRQLCLDPNVGALKLEFTGDRCYCPYNRTYLSPDQNEIESNDLDLNQLSVIFAKRVKACQISFDETLGSQVDLSGAITVRAKEILPRQGKKFKSYEVRKLSPTLSWKNHDDKHTPQGDPTYIGNVLGERLAHFFGFKKSKVEELIIFPSVEKMNHAIRKLNRRIAKFPRSKSFPEWAQGPIEIHFKNVDGLVSDQDYLKMFARSHQVPITKYREGNQILFFHDYSLHVASFLLMPRPLIQRKIRQTRDLLAFEKYLASFQNPELRIVLETFRGERARMIDQPTGNSVISYVKKNQATFRNRLGEFLYRKDQTRQEDFKSEATHYFECIRPYFPSSSFGSHLDLFLTQRARRHTSFTKEISPEFDEILALPTPTDAFDLRRKYLESFLEANQ